MHFIVTALKLSQPLNVNVDEYLWDEDDSDLEIADSQPAQVRIAEKIIHRYIAKRRKLPHRRKWLYAKSRYWRTQNLSAYW